jgi:hypothetical protein
MRYNNSLNNSLRPGPDRAETTAPKELRHSGANETKDAITVPTPISRVAKIGP